LRSGPWLSGATSCGAFRPGEPSEREALGLGGQLAERVPELQPTQCLAIINSQLDARELIVQAVPGIDLTSEAKVPYSPFGRTKGFERISAADAAYLRGTPQPLAIRVPVTIEA
jgi:hypothetical protein